METVLWITLGVVVLVVLMAVSIKLSASRGYLGAKKTPEQYVDESDTRNRGW